MIVDLDGPEEEWLKRMKQKTRYNIRLAKKKDVIITQSDDTAAFAQMMEVTGERDGFGVHSKEYYQRAFELFAKPNNLSKDRYTNCAIIQAEFENKPLAALMVFSRGSRAWYMYGASTNEERNRMPAYLIQWEAMRWAAGHGCTEYDLWGAPDADEEELEANFQNRSDGLWGVYRFKRGFGARVARAVGAYDRVYNKMIYRLYRSYTKDRTGQN